MSSANQELDQQFDDDVMLQLALQMSLQAQPPQSPTAEAAPHEAAPGAQEDVADAEVGTVVPATPAEPVPAPVHQTPGHADAEATTTVSAEGAAAVPASPVATCAEAEPVANETPKKKKKVKKNRYKDIIASRMTSSRTDEDVQREHKEKLEASMGGGQFSKVEKI